MVRELAISRCALETSLGAHVTSIAYPYGEANDVVSHLAGACGYEYGLLAGGRQSSAREPWLALSRIEVTGNDNLDDFVAKLDA